MKRWVAFVLGALLAALVVTPVFAQPSGTPTDPHHSAPEPAPAVPPAGGPGEGHMAMMHMCHQMMGDTSGMAMMGGHAPVDPKMLQMRGEMMKAMGDIMMKHARRMQGMTE